MKKETTILIMEIIVTILVVSWIYTGSILVVSGTTSLLRYITLSFIILAIYYIMLFIPIKHAN